MARSTQGIAIVLTIVFVTGYYYLLEQRTETETRITQTGVASQAGTPATAVTKVLPLPPVSPSISAKPVMAANAIPTPLPLQLPPRLPPWTPPRLPPRLPLPMPPRLPPLQSSPDVASVITVATAIPKTCFMELCNFHDGRAPRLWVMEHTDGAGHRMKNILDGLAVAQKVGMNFGGALSLKHPLTDQHVDFKKLSLAFFGGVKDTGGLFYYNESGPPKWDEKFNNVYQLESKRSSIPAGAFVYLPSANDWTMVNAKASQFYPSTLRAGLARPFASWPLRFAPNRPAVAMHLRRADLPRDSFRATPNEYYYQLALLIRDQLPAADIHIWAALKNIPADPKNHWTPEDFDGFKERGMTVHLDKGQEDDQDVLVAWAHMVRADVYVMSQSSFAYVPAVMNCRCVIFPGSIGKPLDNWINGKDAERKSFNVDFMACMQRAKGIGRSC